MRRLFFVITLALVLTGPVVATAAESSPSFESTYVTGKVIEVTQGEEGQPIYVTRLSDGQTVEVDTYGESVPVGATVYLEYFTEQGYYNYVTVRRTGGIVWLSLIFAASVLVLGRAKGARPLAALAVSIALLFWVLVPMLLHGFDPIMTTIIVGLGVLGVSIFLTHGFSRQSLVSFLGSLASIIVAAILLEIVVGGASLTGLINDHIQYLSFEVEETLNLVRIVSASIIVGILGVLDDITITQVAVVRELSTDERLTPKDLFQKALRVGRDHIASLVNTLVFAYLGASLPMVMFITFLDIPLPILLSHEFIFVEVIRSLVGAIALTLAVPVTTWLAAYVFLPSIQRDATAIDAACAHHHH